MSLDFNPSEDELRSLLYTECRNLQFLSKKWADEKLVGAYKSLQKGSGIEFEEARLYHPGDDARRIDWKVSARKQHPYVKSFREERDQSLIIVADVSPSTLLGINKPKIRKITEIAAFLSTIANKNGDTVGGVTFNQNIVSFIPPKKGPAATFKILHRILKDTQLSNQESTPEKIDSFKEVLISLRKIISGKSMVFILSDYNFESNFKKNLISLSKKHDVYAIRVQDQIENNLPTEGTYALMHPETKEQRIINLSSRKNRASFRQLVANHEQNLRHTFGISNVPFVSLTEIDPIQDSLNAFFQKRSRISGI